MRFSGNPNADALLDSPAPWNFLTNGRKVLYYTFDATPSSVAAHDSNTEVMAFNTVQMQAARQIMAHAGEVTGITFVEVKTSAQADLHFVNADLKGPTTAGMTSKFYNYSYTGSGQTLVSLNAEAVVYLDNVEHAEPNNRPTAGSLGYEVLLHEVGHALGLTHPFDSSRPLPSAQDNTENTVMSYTHAGTYKTMFQPYDLLALDWIYGRDGLGGNYGFNSAKGPTLNLPNSPGNPAPTNPPEPPVTTPNDPVIQVGTARADRFTSTKTNETFDGAQGLDTLVVKGSRGEYAVQRTSEDGWTVGDGVPSRDGIDTLLQMERVKFADSSVALDLEGAAGTAARILGTLVGPSALKNASLVGTVLKAIDAGMSPLQLAQIGLAAVAGEQAAPEQVVELLYRNLFESMPSASTVQSLASLIKSGVYTPASFTLTVANLDLTASHINLVGLSYTGLEYV